MLQRPISLSHAQLQLGRSHCHCLSSASQRSCRGRIPASARIICSSSDNTVVRRGHRETDLCGLLDTTGASSGPTVPRAGKLRNCGARPFAAHFVDPQVSHELERVAADSALICCQVRGNMASSHLIVTSARNSGFEHLTLRRALACCRSRRHFGWS